MIRFELDHVPFSTASIDDAREHLDALGFTSDALGTCRWSLGGSEHEARSLSIVFPDGYLDLIEVTEPSFRKHVRTLPLAACGSVPSGVVLRTSDLGAAREALDRAEIRTHQPYEIVRDLEGGAGGTIPYEIFSFSLAKLPLAVIADSAPQVLRQEVWLRHANSVRAIRCVHLLALGSGTAADELVRAVGDAARLRVHACPPEDPYLRRLAESLAGRPTPSVLCVEFEAGSIEEAREHLETRRVGHEFSSGRIEIGPQHLPGCGMIFRS